MGLDREPGSSRPLPDQFRFDAGTPGLNLLATVGFRRTEAPIERLSTPARLREWFAMHDLPAGPVDASTLAAIRELREAGYGVLVALVDGQRPPAAAVRTLGEWAARPVPGPGLQLDGRAVRRVPPRPTSESVLTELARDLVSVAVDDLAQLRQCPGDSCAMLYLDRSRGARRVWCSMGRCGNRAKAARHRSRAAEAR
jgi:predicted RNA-binding Zn ribbon-like protein